LGGGGVILFYALLVIVASQRIIELLIAKRHEHILKGRGAYEVGEDHYKWIVLLHVLFFIVMIMEVLLFHKRPAPWFWGPLLLFLLAQCVRVWAMRSLGIFWNTKIIVLKGAEVVIKGPYKYVRHPNYLIVATEILTLPLIFQAFFTAIVFTLLNSIMILGVRIPDEERALLEATNYHDRFGGHRRFLPKRPNQP
jgi:methyltransferase